MLNQTSVNSNHFKCSECSMTVLWQYTDSIMTLFVMRVERLIVTTKASFLFGEKPNESSLIHL